MYTNALPVCTPMYTNANNDNMKILEILDEMGEIRNFTFLMSHFLGDT